MHATTLEQMARILKTSRNRLTIMAGVALACAFAIAVLRDHRATPRAAEPPSGDLGDRMVDQTGDTRTQASGSKVNQGHEPKSEVRADLPKSSVRTLRVARKDGTMVELEFHPVEPSIAEQGYPPLGSIFEDGFLTVYHANGYIAEAGPYDGKRKQGVWTYWSESGTPLLEGQYVDGKTEGPWRAWSEDGRLVGDVNTLQGEFHGFCQFWNSKGQPDEEKTGTYERGRKLD